MASGEALFLMRLYPPTLMLVAARHTTRCRDQMVHETLSADEQAGRGRFHCVIVLLVTSNRGHKQNHDRAALTRKPYDREQSCSLHAAEGIRFWSELEYAAYRFLAPRRAQCERIAYMLNVVRPITNSRSWIP